MARSNKFHVDEDDNTPTSNPPMVAATNLGNNVLVVNNAVPADEGQPLLYATAPVEPIPPDVLLRENSDSSSNGSSSHGVAPEDGAIVLSEEEETEKARMMGAGIATGILASLLVGPFLGTLLGFGAAYATKKDGALGDSARAVGDVALTAGAKAKEINQKHNVVERSKIAAGQAWEKAKELDQKHEILTKTKDFCVFCAQSVRDFCQRHRVMERSVEGAKQATTWAGEQLNQVAQQQQQNGNTSSGPSANAALY